MKIILRILLALTISISLVMFSGSHSSEKIISNRDVKVLTDRSSLLPAIDQNLADTLFPTDDGYIDRTGNVIFKLPLGSGNGGAFSDGLAAITFKSGLIGYIDRSGKIVIPPKFRDSQELDGAENFSEGLAAFTSPLVDSQGRDVFGYIDKSGKIAIPAKFVKVGNFHSGVALVIFTNNVNRYAFINKQGEILFENSKLFEIIDHSEFSEGLAAVIKDDKWGFIDVNGTFVIPPKFTNVFKDTKFNEGLVPIKTQTTYSYECGSNPVRTQIGYRDKYGFMDRNGKFEIEPQFDGAKPFSEGLAAVRIYDGNVVKWG